jgi:hypothetical protein
MSTQFKDIVASMVLLPKNIQDLDNVICDKNYKENEPYTGLKCKNYRIINVSGKPYYLKVASVELDDPTKEENTKPEYFIRFIDKKCDTTGVVKDFKSRGLLDPKTTIYFKSAYITYPENIRKDFEAAAKITNETEKLNRIKYLKEETYQKELKIFKQGARSILYHILPYLRKIGIKTIVVDPAPGFLPETIHLTDEQRSEGLKNIYENMGLKEIKCYYGTIGMGLREAILGPDDNKEYDQAFREMNNMGQSLEYDTTVMIGSIDDMLQKMDQATSIPASFAQYLPTSMVEHSQKIYDIRSFLNVPLYSYTNTEKSLGSLNDLLTEEEFKAIIKDSARINHDSLSYFNKAKIDLGRTAVEVVNDVQTGLENIVTKGLDAVTQGIHAVRGIQQQGTQQQGTQQQGTQQQGGSLDYKQKYLKYKAKYLELKNQI